MRGRAVVPAVLALVVLAVLRAVSAPPWPDDWDGIGFAQSIAHFDMDRFAPHAPGYPVYVALLKVAASVARDPVRASNAVAVASGVAAVGLAAWAARRALDVQRAWAVASFVALVPLAWRSGTAIGSEAPALALVCGALLGATFTGARSSLVVGACVGLALGARLSWAPLVLPLVVLVERGWRVRASLVAAVATLAWAVPFAAVVGPAHLVRLFTVHATGHFHVWGGTTLEEPGPMRLAYLARDVFVDGLGVDRDALGAALAVVAAALAATGLVAWRARGYPRARLVLVLVPYLVWLALGQNVRQQPRHALPIVVALCAALALAAMTSRRAQVLGALTLALVAARTFGDARARLTIPPPGAQLVDLAASLGEPSDVAVFGGPSARFFEIERPEIVARVAGTLGDVRLALGRLPSLPKRVLVTGELGGLDLERARLVPLATLCRPERLDRRAPCLEVYDWRAAILAP